MKAIITGITITPSGILDEHSVQINLVDEGAGTFLELHDGQGGKIRLNESELQDVAEAAHKYFYEGEF